MPSVLNTRTKPNSGHLTRELLKRGYDVSEAPLLTVQPTGTSVPGAAADAKALFITSIHAVDAAAVYRHLPAYAVGRTTATALEDAGFTNVRTGPGDARGLSDMLISQNETGPILYPGAETVSFDAIAHWRKHGIEGIFWPVYRTVPATVDARIAERLRAGGFDHVLLTSACSAKALIAVLPKPVGDTALAVMSERIHDALPRAWRARSRVAGEPNELALLSLLRGN